MFGSVLASNLKRYAYMALDYYERTHPGKMLSSAQRGTDIVSDIASEYFPRIKDLDPFWKNLARWACKNYDIPSAAKPVIRSFIQELQARDGEIGKVARLYPEWLYNQSRRLINLAVLEITEGV